MNLEHKQSYLSGVQFRKSETFYKKVYTDLPHDT